jgi:hypothetical protein
MSKMDRPQQPAGFALFGSAGETPRVSGGRWRRSAGARAAALQASSGRAEPVTRHVEELEARQLMFALTVGGDTGNQAPQGQVTNTTTAFGYTLPLLVNVTPEISDGNNEVINESLNDIDLLNFPQDLVRTGSQFPSGELSIVHNLFPTPPAQPVPTNPGALFTPRLFDGSNTQGNPDFEIRVRLARTNNFAPNAPSSFTIAFRQPVLSGGFSTIQRDALVNGVRVPNPESIGLTNQTDSRAIPTIWSDQDFGLNKSVDGTRVRLFLGGRLIWTYLPEAAYLAGGFDPNNNGDDTTARVSNYENGLYNSNGIQAGSGTGEDATPDFERFNFSGFGDTFDRIVIDRIGNPIGANALDDILLDDIQGVLPPGRWAAFVSDRVSGAGAALSGVVQPFSPNPRVSTSPISPGLEQNFDTLPAGPVASGSLLGTSQIQLNSTLTNQPVVAGAAGARRLDFTVTEVGSMDLTFRNAAGALRPVVSAVMSLPTAGVGAFPLTTDSRLAVDLVREGQVVRTILMDSNTILQPAAVNGGQSFFLLQAPNASEFDEANPDPGVRNAFDTIRFRRVEPDPLNPAAPNNLRIDNISAYSPTMVEFFDLYGRPMQPRLDLGVAPERTLAGVDSNDDGVPDFNDGIGRIVISNSTAETNFTMLGGELTLDDDAFVFTAAGPQGRFDELESQRFGYDINRTEPLPAITEAPTVVGLPAGTGAVVIGAPYFRDNRNTAAYVGDGVNQITTYPSARPQDNPAGTPLNLGLGAEVDETTPPAVRLIDFSRLNFSTQPLEDNLANSPETGAPLAPGDVPGSIVRFQGVFTLDGESIGSVSINGVVHGSSNFGGAVARLSMGYLVGSVTVAGDAGQVVLASDVGMFYTRDNSTPVEDGPNQLTGPVVTTGSVMEFGRNLGQLFIAGRNYAQLQVLGDVNNPTRASLDYSRYSELEKMYRVPPPASTDPGEFWSTLTLGQNLNPFTDFEQSALLLQQVVGQPDATAVTGGGQGVAYGAGPIRNETVLGAEYIGNPSGAVTVNGELLGFAPLPDGGGEDGTDVFAFSAGAGRPVTLNAVAAGGSSASFNVRIVDSQGRTLATHQSPAVSPNRLPFGAVSVQLGFTPAATDVYYMVVSAPRTGVSGGQLSYQVGVTGMLPSTAGMVSIGLNNPATTLVNGSLGLMRAGVGVVTPNGVDSSPIGTLMDSVEVARSLFSQRDLSLTVARDATALMFGSGLTQRTSSGTFADNFISVGGNLGTMRTGVAQTIIGSEVNVGDVEVMSLVVGGSIGTIDVARTLGWRELPFNNGAIVEGPAGPVLIQTGTAGGRGDIGAINVGVLISGDTTTIRTPSGSVIDRIAISTTSGRPAAGFIVGSALNLDLGFGSDIRFMEFSGVVRQVGQTNPTLDSSLTFAFNRPIIVTDDSGARVSISISGGTSAGASTGRVVFLPVAGSAGVAIGRIEADLRNGANLVISSLDANGRVSIGRLDLVSTAGIRRSSVLINGIGEVDVLRLQATGSPLEDLRNDTRNGDIVVADVEGVNRVVTAGHLGRTEVSDLSSPLLGPFLGLSNTVVNTVGGAIGFQAQTGLTLNYNFTGTNLYQPFVMPLIVPAITADDFGAPIDPFLNGIVVRSGNVLSVLSNKTVGDVILQGAAGRVDSIIAAADGNVPTGTYEGIVGNIYAFDIGQVDVGSGLKTSPNSALPDAGIFAVNAIQSVIGGRISGAVIGGVIVAANLGATPRGRLPGVGAVTLTNGRFENAYIGSTTFDSFWLSSRFYTAFSNQGSQTQEATDSPVANGAVGNITGNNSPLFRTAIVGRTVGSVNFSNTFFDASRVEARGVSGVATSGTINSVTAQEFRNSTIGGEPLEFRQNLILATNTISSITATRDIADLFIDSASEITNLSGRNLTRVIVNGVGRISSLSASGDLRSSQITSSIISNLNVTGDIRSTTVTAANTITNVQAGGSIQSSKFTISGVGGVLTQLRSTGSLGAEIISAGSIGSVQAGGDFTGLLRTQSPTSGDLASLNVTGNLLAGIEVARNIGTVQAGGQIGRRPTTTSPTRDRIEITGTLGTLQAGKQIYSDVRVGQTINRIQMGAVPSASNIIGDAAGVQRDLVSDAVIVAAGRIETVSATGDMGTAVLSLSGGIGSVTISEGSLRHNGRVQNVIEARDGDLGTVSITNGQLGGNISVPQGSINQITLTRTQPTAGPRWGSIGYEAGLVSTPLSGLNRGEVPVRPATNPNGTRDGVVISAGLDINTVQVARGIYESVIQAGRRLGTVTVTGQVAVNPAFGAADPSFAARRPVLAGGDEIGTVTINGQNLPVGTAGAQGLFLHAGLLSLGSDNAVGGIGAAADTVKSGRVTNVTIRGSAVNSLVLAGIDAGAGGTYTGNGDDAVAPGLSTIQTIAVSNGAIASSNSVVAADTQPVGTFPAGVTAAGNALPVAGGLAFPTGGSTAGFQPITPAGLIITAGNQARVTLTGPGQAWWDAANRRIVLIATSATQSVLTFTRVGANATLTNLHIQSADDASLSAINFSGVQLAGTSRAFVDGDVNAFVFDLVATLPTLAESAAGAANKTFQVGGRIGTLAMGSSAGTSQASSMLVRANRIDRINLVTLFGTDRASRIDARSVGEVSVASNFTGILSVDQSISLLTINGTLTGRVRAGYNIGAVTVGDINAGRISAGGNIDSLLVRGNVTDGAILSGVDLGRDGTFDRYNPTTGVRDPNLQDIPNLPGFEDSVGAGNLGNVTIQGKMERSDIASGISRGNSGFITGVDRLIGEGRSTMGQVRVTTTLTGSTNNAQGYGIQSTGAFGGVTVANQAVTTAVGNLRVGTVTEQPVSLRVSSLNITQPQNGVYVATLTFNQAIQPGANSADLLRAITIEQARDDGTFMLLQGALSFGNGPDNLPNTPDDIDYTLRYDANTRSVIVTFASALTARDLIRSPQTFGRVNPTLPSAGMFRFTIQGGSSANALKSATGNRLDGNGDGFSPAGLADNYVEFAQVGDAGDRITPLVGRRNTVVADYYGPSSLDLVLGSWRTVDGLPQANREYTVRGTLGDHPDNGSSFPQVADVDTFTITLRAGQILKLGRVNGAAVLATRSITTGIGQLQYSSVNFAASLNAGIPNPPRTLVDRDEALQLLDPSDPFDQTENFLVRTTGQYIIAMGAVTSDLSLSTTFITTTPTGSPAGRVGDYSFTVNVVDDGDSGFAGEIVPLDAGQLLPNQVPLPTNFNILAGVPQLAALIVADPRNSAALAPTPFQNLPQGGQLEVGTYDSVYPAFVFTLNAGPNGTFGNADDIVTGTNGRGIRITRTGTNGAVVPTVTRENAAGVAVGVQGTTALIADSVPLATAFANANSTVVVNSTRPTFARYVFQRLTGPDGVFGNTDDLVAPTSIVLSTDGIFGNGNDQTLTDPSALGVNMTRQAASGLGFDAATDIVRVTSNAGDGVLATRQAPRPGDFAGLDGQLGTPDDVRSIDRGEFVYTLLSGTTNGVLNGNGTAGARSNDRVVGVNRFGMQYTRTAGADGIFRVRGEDAFAGVSDDLFTSSQAIGQIGNSGIPATGVVEPDVIHLNSGQTVAPGTRYRVTLKLTRDGGNIGLLQPVLDRVGNNLFYRVADTRGLVQFGIFETTRVNDGVFVNGNGLSDATALATTNNVVGYSGNELRTGQRVSNINTGNAYGYDANGDFFFEYSTPASQLLVDPTDPNNPALPLNQRGGNYAVYIQGAVRSDYQVEVTQLPAFTPPPSAPAVKSQNVLISTAGGSVSWLEANPYVPTSFIGLDPSFNGLTGQFEGSDVAPFIIDSPLNTDATGAQQNLIARLQRMFDQSVGLNADGSPKVRFSSNAADFQGQDFSTVFITSSTAPAPFTGSVLNGRFGESQLIDPFNANTRDEAIIFANEFNALGSQPTRAGVDQFTLALSGAVGRRVGELLGLRLTSEGIPSAIKLPPTGQIVTSGDVMSTSSVLSAPVFNALGGVFDFFGGIAPNLVNQAGLGDQFGQGLNESLFATFGSNLAGQRLGTAFGQFSEFRVPIPNANTQFLMGQQYGVSLLSRVVF